MKILDLVPGTGRRRVIASNGKEFERQFVYLDHYTWEALRKLAAQQGIGLSLAIAKMIHRANSGPNQANG